MGLMKLAMYHRLQGNWDVFFYKGDLKDFVASELTREAILRLKGIEPECPWEEFTPDIFLFIKSRKAPKVQPHFEQVLEESLFGNAILEDYRRGFKNGAYFEMKPWDRVCVTTLFTFYAKITYETIEFAKRIVKNPDQLMVGGIMASVVPEEIEKKTGVRPYQGCIYDNKIFDDPPLDHSVDSLPLDYSILEEIDYQYPETNGYYGYMTRGCVNRCPFCAVPKLEPNYQEYIPLKWRVDTIKERFGEQKDLLLLDNNVFASKRYSDIIEDIKQCGFSVGSKFTPPNQLEIVIKQLEESWNDRAYIRKGVKLLNEYLESLVGEDRERLRLFLIENRLLHDFTAKKDSVLKACRLIRDDYQKRHAKIHRPVSRYVDFNQGVDARLATEEKIKELSTVSIRPLRVAFDNWGIRKDYVRAMYYASKYGITNASNYLLYNFRDEPIDLYNRLLLNIDLATALNIAIYSFPMKYHPIMEPQWFDNRDFLGEKWTRKEIRTIQVILNATKGKVGSSRSFFFAAFGLDEAAFKELLRMPEAFILNRYDAEACRLTDQWRDSYDSIQKTERDIVDKIIGTNHFVRGEWIRLSKKTQKFLEFYLYSKDGIPKASKEIKNSIRDRFIESAPSNISPICEELLKTVKSHE